MNLLIVEDEPIFLNNLVHQIPWDDYGFEVMSANNGREALRLIQNKRPDIMLLDIQMPEMDGLTLAQTVHANQPQVKTIVLSGHDNFNYAHKAIELGVVKYLLKPVEDSEIVDAVLEAARIIKKEWERNHDHEALLQKWAQHLPRLQADFFQNLIGGRYAEWEIRRRSADLMLHLTEHPSNAAVVVQMDPLLETETRFSDKDRALLQFSLHSIAGELLTEADCRMIYDSDGDTVLLFINRPEDEHELMSRMNGTVLRLISVVKECLKLTASAGIGTCVSLERIPDSYSQAKRALQDRAIYGHDLVIPYRETRTADESGTRDHSFTKALEVALLTGEQEQAVSLIRAFASEKLEGSASLVEVQDFLLWISGLLTRIIQSQNWSVKQVVGDDYAYYLNLNGLLTKEQMLEWLARSARSIASYVGTQRTSHHELIMRQVLTHVEEKMEQDLTLNAIADSLYINSSYLSRLFKQETGQPFSAYVLERKMERARELLLDGHKVHDVAVMTGYKEDSYFIKVFRKYWGVTPGEIRSGT